MTADEAREAIGRLFVAFPSYRQWLESTDQPNATLDAWCDMLAGCDARLVGMIVDRMLAGDMELHGRYEKPDALPRTIRREANDLRYEQTRKRTQFEKYHQSEPMPWRTDSGDSRFCFAMRIAISPDWKLTDDQVEELCQWANHDGPRPEWMP